MRNLVELVMVMSPAHPIGLNELPAEFHGATALPAAAACATDLKSVEQATIAAAVHACGGNFTKAAKRLGIARSTLYSRFAGPDQMGRT